MLRRERERAIDEVLRLVNLQETAERLVRTSFEEMVRRREVAGAILHRRLLLVHAEPTDGPDCVRRSVCEALFVSSRGDGTTPICTTQHTGEAGSYTDRVASMNRGQSRRRLRYACRTRAGCPEGDDWGRCLFGIDR